MAFYFIKGKPTFNLPEKAIIFMTAGSRAIQEDGNLSHS
jgi:hypothetical protein